MAPFTVKFYKNNQEDKAVNIDIINSNITNIKCHILVNSCQNNLGSGSGVHGAIRSAAGQPYINECNMIMRGRNQKILNATEYVITDAGNMKDVGKIFNIRAPINNTGDDSEQEPALKIAYNNIFDYVIDNKYTDKVIAMTTLGTGVFNISIGTSTNTLMQSLKHKLKKMLDSSVRRIIIVSNDQTQIDDIIYIVKEFVKVWNTRSLFDNYTFEINE